MSYSTKLASFYYFIEYSILFFNSLNIIVGTILFSYYIQHIDKTNNNTIIENCDNIFLLDFLGIINSFLVFSIVSSIFEIKALSFGSNIVLSCYNYYHLHKLSHYCISYYSSNVNNINYVSIDFLFNLFVQSITNIMFLICICVFIRVYCHNKINRNASPSLTETSRLIHNNYHSQEDYQEDCHNNENLYDDIDLEN